MWTEHPTNRQTDKQTNRQSDKQTNRQTDKQTNRQTDKPIDKHPGSGTDKNPLRWEKKICKILSLKYSTISLHVSPHIDIDIVLIFLWMGLFLFAILREVAKKSYFLNGRAINRGVGKGRASKEKITFLELFFLLLFENKRYFT